jgi:trimeric autotransporter adhesin
MKTTTILTLLFVNFLFSQVGIGTTTPNGALEVNSINQGLVIPRVSLTRTNVAAPVTNPSNGGYPLTSTIVYNTNTSPAGANSVSPGFYYWSDSQWVRINTDLGWLINGNSNIDEATHFLGTINNSDLIFKRNNTIAGKLAVSNTSYGLNSLKNTTTGRENTSVGVSSLMANTTGDYNVAIGYGSLERNTTGILNTSVGNKSLYNNLDGRANIGIGTYSLERNSSGNNNVAVGVFAAYNNITGNNNIALGYSALNRNTNGNRNIAIGSSSLEVIGSSNNCIAIGHDSQVSNLSGEYNLSIGNSSLFVNQTGSNNIALGYNAYNNGNFNNSIAIGNNVAITASNQIRIGNSSTTSIGGFASWTNVSDERFKSEIDYTNVPGLDFILKLKPVTYRLDLNKINKQLNTKLESNQNSNIQTGFIAQEVENISNQINYAFSGVDKPKNENDFYGLRYAEFVVPLTKAIQEQQAIIQNLQDEIKELKNLIQDISDNTPENR